MSPELGDGRKASVACHQSLVTAEKVWLLVTRAWRQQETGKLRPKWHLIRKLRLDLNNKGKSGGILNKKQVLIVMVAVIAVSGMMFFTGRGKSRAPATPPKITQAPVAIPKTIPPVPQPSATNEIAQAATGDFLPGTDETALSGGTEEIDLDKIVWAREYLRKYRGKIDDIKLSKLNGLVKMVSDFGYADSLSLQFLLDNKNQLVAPIIDMSRDASLDFFRLGIIELLGKIQDNQAVESLIDLTKAQETDEVRFVAIISLSEISSEASMNRIIEIAEDKNDTQRGQALISLRSGKKSLDLLHSAMQDTDYTTEEEMKACAYALRAFGKNNESTKLLEQIITSENHESETKGVALLSLSMIDPESAIPYIKIGIASSEHLFKSNAISSVFYVSDPDVHYLALKILLNNEESIVLRGNASSALNNHVDQTIEKIILEKFSELDDFGAILCTKLLIQCKDQRLGKILQDRINSTNDDYCIEHMEALLKQIEKEGE
ncbi:MAG: HEAT repeat domain-containing protein [Candidatus Wallbacteria bacterium]|nr:HEAT repeat domain-containing protein [Candidatus Wallbacteria bacterium]